MSALLQRRILNWGAAALLALGVFWSAQSWRDGQDRLRQIRRKAGQLSELLLRQQQQRADRLALAQFEKLAARPAASLSELAHGAAPDFPPEIRPRDSRNVVSGWLVRRADVTFNELPLELLARFIEKAEAQRPPWRLSECQIWASDRSAGAARVNLVLEALERTGPAK